MVVYVRAKGLYAGLNLNGSVISIDDKANAAFYGRQVTPVDILVKHTASNAAGEALAKDMARTSAAAGH
jgi:lipid-binding SYLF domain-containing protein